MTRIGVQVAPGRARLVLTGGHISPRVLRMTENGARIGLVATTALLLGGDHIDIDIDVGPGAWIELVETTGTVAYDADGVASSWTVRIRVADGGALIWAGEPFVVSHGANVRRSTAVDLGQGAIACLRETLVLGRSGETGGAIRSTLSARQSGTLLVLEDLDLTDAGVRELPGLLGVARVIDTVCLLGRPAPPEPAPPEPALPPGMRFDLDGPGTLARCLTTTLAASPLAPITAAWEWAAWEWAARERAVREASREAARERAAWEASPEAVRERAVRVTREQTVSAATTS